MTAGADARCSALSRAAGEPMAGSAPRADTWVVVEHPAGWGDAALARTGSGVRVLMARGFRAVGRRGGGHDSGGQDSSGQDSGGLGRATGVRVWVAHCDAEPVLRVGSVADPREVAGWDLAGIAAGSHRDWGRPDPEPMLLVCANGRRDRCCGHSGQRLAEQLWSDGHTRRVLTCTHLGGHRFAPTALLIPSGVLHGRLDVESAEIVLAEARLGRTPTATLRGFSVQPEPAQVADAHVRARTGHAGLAALGVTLTGSADPDRMRAEVSVPAVHPSTAPSAPAAIELVRRSTRTVASCGREAEQSQRWFVAPPAP